MIFNQKYEKLFDIYQYPQIRYIAIIGGRASGKSTAVAHFLHDISFNNDHVILNSRFTMASTKDSVIAEMEKAITERQSHNIFEKANNTLYNNISGTKIIFKGLQTGSLKQTAKLKSTTDLNIWLLDEAEELHDESVFDDIDDSIRRECYHNLIIMVLNSHHVTKEHFIYKRFFANKGVNWGFNGIDKNTLYIHTTFLDNWINLSKSYQQKIKYTKENYPDKYKFNFLGELREKAMGVIFKNWQYGEFDESLPFAYGLDFGVTDPDALVKVAIDNKRKIIYCKELMYANNQSSDVLAQQLSQLTEKDKMIVADSSGKRVIIDLMQKGVNIRPVRKRPGQIVSDIKKMLSYEIIITKESHNLAKELNNYIWADKKGEIPVDAYNHLIDALRYAGSILNLMG